MADESKFDQFKGNVKETVGNAKNKITDAIDKLKK